MNDNKENMSSKITVGTYFNGELAGKRVVLLDSPGVNSSENIEHKEISQRMIKSKKYKLVVYVLNSTNLGATDEEAHLESVRERLGRAKIIFAMNKADNLISEDDDFLGAIEGQREFLISKGYKNPTICPVSSQAAYLVKKSLSNGVSRLDRRLLENYIDKFEGQSLTDYYVQQLGCDPMSSNDEMQSLLINSGFAYFEKIISDISDGGKTNDTGLR